MALFCSPTEAWAIRVSVEASMNNLATALNSAKVPGKLPADSLLSQQIVGIASQVGTFLGTYNSSLVMERLACNAITEAQRLHGLMTAAATQLQQQSGVAAQVDPLPISPDTATQLAAAATDLMGTLFKWAIVGGVVYFGGKWLLDNSRAGQLRKVRGDWPDYA